MKRTLAHRYSEKRTAASIIASRGVLVVHRRVFVVVHHSRTTFAFDTVTIKRIKRLAEHWQVSLAEAVRRAVEFTEKKEFILYEKVTQQLSGYHATGGVAKEEADTYLAELSKDRNNWRDIS